MSVFRAISVIFMIIILVYSVLGVSSPLKKSPFSYISEYNYKINCKNKEISYRDKVIYKESEDALYEIVSLEIVKERHYDRWRIIPSWCKEDTFNFYPSLDENSPEIVVLLNKNSGKFVQYTELFFNSGRLIDKNHHVSGEYFIAENINGCWLINQKKIKGDCNELNAAASLMKINYIPSSYEKDMVTWYYGSNEIDFVAKEKHSATVFRLSYAWIVEALAIDSRLSINSASLNDISDNNIQISVSYYADTDPMCCPSRSYLRWNTQTNKLTLSR